MSGETSEAKPKLISAAGHTAQGLCDMAGNVWEWVEDDWHRTYNGAPADGSAWVDAPRDSGRVDRGGSWDSGADRARSSNRRSVAPARAYGGRGFRIARSAR